MPATAHVTENQPAPALATQDVFGKPVSLADLKGQKVFLIFYRTAGCPVCNLRFHQMEQQAAYFKAHHIAVLAVYQSQAENLRTYIGQDTLYPRMIADPTGILYARYGIERSMGKLFKGVLFHGGLGKLNRGKKLFKTPVKDDGPTNLIGAEFLINPDGRVATAHYGRYSGDFLPLDTIKAFAER